MDKNEYGVHASHCCKKCGCKYQDDDCPVENGLIEPIYGCQDCEESEEYLLANLREYSKEELENLLKKL